MSQCFRTLPGRLSSLVSSGSGRKLLSKFDRLQLQKNVESSAFLKQVHRAKRSITLGGCRIAMCRQCPPAIDVLTSKCLHNRATLNSRRIRRNEDSRRDFRNIAKLESKDDCTRYVIAKTGRWIVDARCTECARSIARASFQLFIRDNCFL